MSRSLPPPFVHLATCITEFLALRRGGAVRWCTTVQAAYCRFTPGVLAPVRVMLSRSIIA